MAWNSRMSDESNATIFIDLLLTNAASSP